MSDLGQLGLTLHDSLRGDAAPLARRGEVVGVYCCGPTTYDVAHVGHARAALAPDVLVRHLRAKGVRVKYVRNVTDVDDKILKRAKESGEEPTALSARMTALYRDDMRRLGCVTPDVEPLVSEHIDAIVDLIERLVEKGAAYAVTREGDVRDVYYAVRAFPGYGKLSKRNVEELRVGARIEASDIKRDPLDFALWKGCGPDEWGWDTRLGRGRPGWHIECSAMSEKHLGFGFDVHCGGMDLVFPHHENEIAQSEAAHPDEGPFCHTWIHNGFVNVDKEKMAKSLGNFVTIRDVYDRNDPEALRYFLLGVHYRGPIAFDTVKHDDGRVVFPGVIEAERRVDYLYGALSRAAELRHHAGEAEPSPMPRELATAAKLATSGEASLAAALDDDLNTPVALSVLAELAKAANELVDLFEKRKKDEKFRRAAASVGTQLAVTLRACLDRLGLLQTPVDDYTERTRAQRLRIRSLTAEAVEATLRARDEARKARDFAKSDELRKALADQGIELADTPSGTTWRVAVL